MSARFRIRTSQGQEISFASHEMFAEFVRSGELSPDDVVYDAETREWSSALTHPVVLGIESEAEDAGDGGPGDLDGSEATGDAPQPAAAGGEDAKPTAGASEDGAEIGLELAPQLPQLSPEEQAAAFVKKMEAERASEQEFEGESELQGFKMEQGSSGLVGGFTGAPEKAPSKPARSRPEPPRRREPPSGPARGEATSREEPARPAKAPKRKKRGAGGRYAAALIVAAALVGGGIYFGPQILESTAASPESEAGIPEGGVELPPPEPLIPDTEDALRERAQERFLTTTRALLRDTPTIPAAWLTGSYLATPSDYPEVREAWNEVLTLIRQIRAGDNDRYRAGYTRALDDARVEGSARTLRLAAAVAAFQGDVAPRAAHYDRVEGLATAALRAHDALVEAEGMIAYEPATSTPVSGDPVIEAVGRNPEAQDLLDEILDMVLVELEEPNGPGQASNLGEWIWDGILDAVAA